MKKVLLTAALVVGTIGAFAQGTVNFNNASVNVRVLDTTGANVGGSVAGGGTNYFAQLYWAAGNVTDSSLLVAAGAPVNFRSLANGGLIQTSGTTSLGFSPVSAVLTLAPLTPGGAVTLQMRAWWGGGNVLGTWDVARVSDNPLAAIGASTLFSLAATGDPTASPAGTPVNMVGLTTFSLATLAPIPEPSTFALAGLAGAAMLIFRRRK